MSRTSCTRSESFQRGPLGSRVGQEGPDGLVQPLRFLQHDVHQLGLLLVEGQLSAEDLHRPRHRGQRVPDLVRDAGCHLAHRRQALAPARVAFEPLDVGHVLKREQAAAPPVWKCQGRRRQSQLDRAAVRRPIGEIGAPPTGFTAAIEMLTERARQRQHVASVLPERTPGREAGDGRGRPVERQHVPIGIGGHQAAHQAVDHVGVERPQVGDRRRRVHQPVPGRAKPFGQRPRQQRHTQEARDVDDDDVPGEGHGRQTRRPRHPSRKVLEADIWAATIEK